MTEYSPNKYGLNPSEASKFLEFAADQAEWDGDPFLAEDLRKQKAYFRPIYPDGQYDLSARCYSPHFDNPYWKEWRNKNGITAWEEVAGKCDDAKQAYSASRV